MEKLQATKNLVVTIINTRNMIITFLGQSDGQNMALVGL
jgi:hypothetical protein